MPSRALCASLLVIAIATSSHIAWADDVAGALALFNEARALMQEQKYELACAKFAESQRLGPAPGTLLNLGECQHKLGKTATAWATFNEAASAAQRAGQSDRDSYARKRAAELEGSLPRLTIRVPSSSDVPGLVVRRDGTDLGKSAWNTALPVDPGDHVIEASAPDRRAWRTRANVVDGGQGEVTLPILQPEREDTPHPSASLFTRRRIGVVVGGLGVAAAAAGGVFGLSAISSNDEANGHCRTADLCDATGLALKDDARREAMLSTVFTIGGAALLVGGVVLFLTAKDDPPPSRGALTVRFAPGGATARW